MRRNYFILLIILLLFPLGVFAKNDIYSKNASIYIDEYGTANVTETWEVKGQDGTEWYIPLTNLGKSSVSDFSVMMDGTMLTQKTWNVNESIKQKAGYYGYNYIDNGVELCFGKTDYKKHTFVIKYTISNFVFTTNDADVISWRIFEYQNNKTRWQNFSAIIKSYYTFPDSLDVWGFGYKGYAYVKDGVIQMSNEGDMRTNYVVLQAKFPKGTFKNLVRYSNFNTFEDVNNANSENTYDYDYNTDSQSFLSKMLEFLSGIIPILFWVAVLASGVSLTGQEFGYKDNKKIDKNNTNIFREIPCNKDIQYANTLIYLNKFGYKESNIIGAIILKWVRDDKITFIKKEKAFGGEESVLDLTKNPTFDNDFESELFSIMHKASGDGYLESKELEKYCRSHYSSFFRLFSKNNLDQVEKLMKEGQIRKRVDRKECKAKKVLSEKIYEDSKELYGLKLFFEEFAKMDTKETLEVKLWDEYLMFAYLFGMADRVAKQLKNLYPEYMEQEFQNRNFDFDTIISINRIASRSVNAASAARSAAQSYSAGGGGFSSGGGGGGSFGGGGSSGGGGSR